MHVQDCIEENTQVFPVVGKIAGLGGRSYADPARTNPFALWDTWCH